MADLQEEALLVQREWVEVARTTGAADRPRAESSITDIYRMAGLPRPSFVWFDNPAPLLSTARLLGAPLQDGSLEPVVWEAFLSTPPSADLAREILDEAGLRPSPERPRVESRIMRLLSDATKPVVGGDGLLDGLLAEVSAEVYRRAPDHALFGLGLREAAWDEVVARLERRGVEVDWEEALHGFNAVPPIGALGGYFYGQLGAGGFAPRDLLLRAGQIPGPDAARALFDQARSAGPWCPFSDVVFVSERPTGFGVHDPDRPAGADRPRPIWRHR